MPSRRLSRLLRHLAPAVAALAWTGAFAQSPAVLQADAAMAALSARYTQIWASLDADGRARFSAEERAWLNRGRWDEQKQCMARNPAVDADERAAQCAQQVIERRLQQLAPAAHALVHM
jgi:hypothetical protein